jgi:hypothetical protein
VQGDGGWQVGHRITVHAHVDHVDEREAVRRHQRCPAPDRGPVDATQVHRDPRHRRYRQRLFAQRLQRPHPNGPTVDLQFVAGLQGSGAERSGDDRAAAADRE